MDIIVVLLLVLILILSINFIGNLKEMEEVINEITLKHNATVDLIDKLNKRIGDIEKERDETKSTS